MYSENYYVTVHVVFWWSEHEIDKGSFDSTEKRIVARHGRRFKDAELQANFDSKSFKAYY